MAYSFLQEANSATDATEYTFSTQSLGDAAADRHIIVTVMTRKVGTSPAVLSSLTVGGVTATISVQQGRFLTNSTTVGIAIAAVPTGTTGDVVVTWNSAVVRCGIALYRATGLSSATAADTDSAVANDPSVTLDVPAGGFAVGVAAVGVGTTATWSGITEDHDTIVETSSAFSSASLEFAEEQTGVTLTCDWASSGEDVGAFASWGVAAGSTTILPQMLAQGLFVGAQR